MRSVMKHNFAQVPRADIPRSSFDLSFGHKTTFDAGQIIPIYVDECLPGDTFNVRMTAFARLATPIFPVMDNMFLETFFFAVPYRLVMENFVRLMGEQPNPDDSTDFTIPTITAPAGGFTEGSIYDYLGIPTKVAGLQISALPLRAINLCWNEWFRDENLQDRVVQKIDDGPDDPALYTILKRGKRYDYFTGCLPWPQKGPGVLLPLGTTAPIISDPVGAPNGRINFGNNATTPLGLFSTTGTNAVSTASAAATGGLRWTTDTGLLADLTQASAATINSLRQAFQVQKMYERDARGGTRYVELLKSHFQVDSPDYRLQRPEFLGGGRSSVNISPIPQTSASGTYAATPQGTLAAMGTVSAHNHGFTHSFTEHTIVLGFVAVRADLTYSQGLDKMWSRRTRHDFYWPALQALGEQAVLNKEIYAQGTAADDQAFGYQERWSEYRFHNSKITGLFRPNAAQSLDAWHLSQEFANLPVLNNEFITDNPPVDRVLAVPSEPHFLFDSYFKIRAARPMPTYSVPGYIDHF